MVRVGWLRAGSSVVLLGLTSIEALGWTADGSRNTCVQVRVRARRLPGRRHIVSPEIVLVEGLGKSFLQHPVVVSYGSLQLGMQIKQCV